MHGYCHVEIPATDTDQAARFYSNLFGWTTKEMAPGYVFYMDQAGEILGGITKVAKMPDNTDFQNYVEVPSTAHVIEKAKKLGATIHSERRAVPSGSGGWIAVLRSPDGFLFGIFGEE